MKKIWLSLAVLCTAFQLRANKSDTLQVYMDGADLRVEVSDVEELEEISEHDLNQIVNDILETSAENEDSLELGKAVEFELNSREESASVDEFMKEKREEIDVYENKEDSAGNHYVALSIGVPSGKWEDKKRTITNTQIRFGLNNYLEEGNFPGTGSNYELGAVNSRVFAIGFYSQTRIFKEKSPLHVRYGIEYTFNNYKLQNNVRIVEGDEHIEFNKDEVNNYSKSKLATIYLDVPVMLQLDFKHKRESGYYRRDFMIGLGAYAGYRLRSITKHKYEDTDGDDQKDKHKGSLYLNNFRYGLEGMIAFRKITFFGRYQMNELFESHVNTPKLNPIELGIIFAIDRE